MEVLALPQGAQLGGSSCLASVTHKVGHLAAQLRWRLEEAFPHSYGHLMLPVLWVSVPRGASWVMLAASYWSLLAPAVEMATSSGGFGSFAFFPVAVGFTLGAAFVYLADLLMPHLGAAEDPPTALALNFTPASLKKSDTEGPRLLFPESELSIRIGRAGLLSDKSENGEAYQRKKTVATGLPEGPAAPAPPRGNPVQPGSGSWRRIALLILAITIHNIPEGLAVGVGFGAIGKTASATFESARWLVWISPLTRGIGSHHSLQGEARAQPSPSGEWTSA
ncbi:zinc transporter ZIP11 isoform X10 [Mustela putorius furo]|uniref:Zinc transporter ZIP11 isoform X10 n=1 Tax=Mustela putorius furo TaxID=9669 RepID=A0A8U0V7S3_MUSPF|nr:zinc transporter ZIP11 isoform X10 [Mustela putorius furo]